MLSLPECGYLFPAAEQRKEGKSATRELFPTMKKARRINHPRLDFRSAEKAY